jgi:cytolysin-activating lysine-acyltransferase
MAQTFSQVVSVLMRDPSCKDLKIADLEWLVLPPLMSGQFRLAHAARPADGAPPAGGADKERRIGALVPVAVALWARVSPLVDKALSENLETNVRLSASAWTSGDILWLLAVAGNPRALPAFLKQLRENEFKGRQVRMRLRAPDGRIVVSDLGLPASAA